MTKEEKELQEQAKAVLEKMKGEKKIIRLHHSPNAIKQSIKDLQEMSEDEDMKNLFEDIGILVEWALKRLPIVPPKEKENEKVS
jgi:uncharacterized protein YydD (DUF2326 family)